MVYATKKHGRKLKSLVPNLLCSFIKLNYQIKTLVYTYGFPHLARLLITEYEKHRFTPSTGIMQIYMQQLVMVTLHYMLSFRSQII